mgnify:CR=1 FL=1
MRSPRVKKSFVRDAKKNKIKRGVIMKIERSNIKDVDTIMQILLDARGRIGRLGIDQWQYGYPSRDIVIEDVNLHRSFVARDEEGCICATLTMLDDGEPTYDKIYEGEWIAEGKPYIAVHRIAVAGDKLRCGIASAVMQEVENRAKDIGYASVRIDTHAGNIPMRAMLEKNGYKCCGTIYLTDGQSRCAYEKAV